MEKKKSQGLSFDLSFVIEKAFPGSPWCQVISMEHRMWETLKRYEYWAYQKLAQGAKEEEEIRELVWDNPGLFNIPKEKQTPRQIRIGSLFEKWQKRLMQSAKAFSFGTFVSEKKEQKDEVTNSVIQHVDAMLSAWKQRYQDASYLWLMRHVLRKCGFQEDEGASFVFTMESLGRDFA
jgi:hypothetical protein